MSEIPAAPPAATRLPHAEFVTMVAFLMALNAMAIDVILPALQQMGESLGVTDENARQFPLSAYIAFFGLSQIVYGTLSDRFGRRPVLLFGLVIYVLGCIGSAVAGSFTMLLAMRAIQGLGAGATRVIAISIVRDTYGGRQMASVMSMAMMVFMAVPIIAPTVGQGIMMLASWRAILMAIAVFGVLMTLWCFVRLPETLHPEDRRELRVGPVTADCRARRRGRFWTAIAAGLSSEVAAASVSVSQAVGSRGSGAGGMPQRCSGHRRPLSGRYLSFAAREIALLRARAAPAGWRVGRRRLRHLPAGRNASTRAAA